MSLNQFIDTGADNATVNDMNKSIAREEDLQKAMNKAGLVQKEVQVKGKNGQMFTRKQWVKANDAQSTGTTGTSSVSKGDAKSTKSTSSSTEKLDPFQVGGSNVTHYVNRKKFPPTGFSSASLAGKNIGEVLSGQSKEFVSKGAKDEAIRATKEAIRSHKRGLKDPNYRDSLYSESKEKQIIEAATELLAKLEEIPVRGQSQSKSDDKAPSGKFKPSDFQFRSGGQNVADFVNSIDKELGVKKHTNGNVGFGTLSLENGASVNFGYDDTGAYATWNGSNFRDVRSLKSAMSGQKSDQGKMNHQTGVREKAATMIEDYFAGNHSHEDGKKALAGLLGKGYSREDIMAQAEKSGVTWKKNDHAGINWMRASMAIQKHLNSIKESSSNAEAKQSELSIKPETTDKNSSVFSGEQLSKLSSLVNDCNKETVDNNWSLNIQNKDIMSSNAAIKAVMFMHTISDVSDVAGTNKKLRELADKLGITEHGGTIIMDSKGKVRCTAADGNSKVVFTSYGENKGFINNDRFSSNFFSCRGASTTDKYLDNKRREAIFNSDGTPKKHTKLDSNYPDKDDIKRSRVLNKPPVGSNIEYLGDLDNHMVFYNRNTGNYSRVYNT